MDDRTPGRDNEMSGSPDYDLFRAINGLAGRNPAVDAIVVACAKFLPVVFALALVGLWLTWRPTNQRAAFLAGVSALVALGIGQLIGMALPRPRPYLTHQVNLLISPTADTSFPSDHATLGFAVAVLVWRYNRRAGTVLLLVALLLAFARVFVGVHYPSDVLGGAVLGTLTSKGITLLSESSPLRNWLNAFFALLARWRLAANSPETIIEPTAIQGK
jgi:undecaprenyl-diphosphatase